MRALKADTRIFWKRVYAGQINRLAVALQRLPGQIRVNGRHRLAVEVGWDEVERNPSVRGRVLPGFASTLNPAYGLSGAETDQRYPHRRAVVDPRFVAPGVEDAEPFDSAQGPPLAAAQGCQL